MDGLPTQEQGRTTMHLSSVPDFCARTRELSAEISHIAEQSCLPRQPRTEDYGRELDHIPDANLPDPKSVPADVQLLVEEARIGYTSAIPSRRHRNMIDIRIFDHRGQSSLGVANSCWVCSSQSVERSTLARRPFYWSGETSFRQPVVQARRLSRSANLPPKTDGATRMAGGRRPLS